jgi:hypothetical protein
MINDSLVDWLKLGNCQGNQKTFKSNDSFCGFTEFIMNKGVEFEKEIIKYIHENKIPVVNVSEYITEESLNKTKNLMMSGTPLIHSAPVRNIVNGTQGVIDILIRSDFLDKLKD